MFPTVSNSNNSAIHSFGGSVDALARHVLCALDRLALGAGQVGAMLRLHAQAVHGGAADDRISDGKREKIITQPQLDKFNVIKIILRFRPSQISKLLSIDAPHLHLTSSLSSFLSGMYPSTQPQLPLTTSPAPSAGVSAVAGESGMVPSNPGKKLRQDSTIEFAEFGKPF